MYFLLFFPVTEFILVCHPSNYLCISAGEHMRSVYFKNQPYFILFLFLGSDCLTYIDMSKESSNQYPKSRDLVLEHNTMSVFFFFLYLFSCFCLLSIYFFKRVYWVVRILVRRWCVQIHCLWRIIWKPSYHTEVPYEQSSFWWTMFFKYRFPSVHNLLVISCGIMVSFNSFWYFWQVGHP